MRGGMACTVIAWTLLVRQLLACRTCSYAPVIIVHVAWRELEKGFRVKHWFYCCSLSGAAYKARTSDLYIYIGHCDCATVSMESKYIM